MIIRLAASTQLNPGESRSGSGAGSAGSGYESDLRHSGSDGSWDPKPRKYGIFTKQVICACTRVFHSYFGLSRANEGGIY